MDFRTVTVALRLKANVITFAVCFPAVGVGGGEGGLNVDMQIGCTRESGIIQIEKPAKMIFKTCKTRLKTLPEGVNLTTCDNCVCQSL